MLICKFQFQCGIAASKGIQILGLIRRNITCDSGQQIQSEVANRDYQLCSPIVTQITFFTFHIYAFLGTKIYNL